MLELLDRPLNIGVMTMLFNKLTIVVIRKLYIPAVSVLPLGQLGDRLGRKAKGAYKLLIRGAKKIKEVVIEDKKKDNFISDML